MQCKCARCAQDFAGDIAISLSCPTCGKECLLVLAPWIAARITKSLGYIRAGFQEDLDRGRFMTDAPYTPDDIAQLTIGIVYTETILKLLESAAN